MRPIIAFDLDDVLNELVRPWIDEYNVIYNDSLMPREITSWNIASFATNCTPAQFRAILTPEFYEKRVPRAPGAWDAIYDADFLLDAKVYVVSSYKGYESTMAAKVDWVSRELNPKIIQDVVFLNDKSRFKCDYLIDDGIHNLIGEGEYHPILISKPWNRGQGYEKTIPTYHNVSEAVRHIVDRERKGT